MSKMRFATLRLPEYAIALIGIALCEYETEDSNETEWIDVLLRFFEDIIYEEDSDES